MSNLQRYVQDDGRTMRNRFGIRRDPEAFESALSKVTADRIQDLREDPSLITQTFDEAHLKSLHQYITQDAFEWAGRTRNQTVNIEGETIGPVPIMAKPGGRDFDEAKHIPRGFALLHAMTDTDKAAKMDRNTFCEHAARIFTHLNQMHPFREGNGRVQREFIYSYAKTAGHELDFSVVTQGRMYEVSDDSTRDDYSAMTRLFQEISNPEAVARMRPAFDGFSRKDGFQQLYFAHTRPGREVEGEFIGKGKDGFALQRKDRSILIGDQRDLIGDPQPGQELRFTPKDHTPKSSKRTEKAR